MPDPTGRNNHNLPTRQRNARERGEAFLRLYEQGLTQKQIGKIFGLCQSSVAFAMKAYSSYEPRPYIRRKARGAAKNSGDAATHGVDHGQLAS